MEDCLARRDSAGAGDKSRARFSNLDLLREEGAVK